MFDHFVGLVLKELKGDSDGFRRRMNLEQFIVFKQSILLMYLAFFLILKYYLSKRQALDLKYGYSAFRQSTTLKSKPALTLPSV